MRRWEIVITLRTNTERTYDEARQIADQLVPRVERQATELNGGVVPHHELVGVDVRQVAL